MSNVTGSLFGIHAQALNVWQKRAEVIASNLANADTPGYKARGVNFREILSKSGGSSLELLTADPRQISDTPSDDITLSWRVPVQPSMDGNTVDPDIEQAAYASNDVHYQASLTFIGAEIQRLQLAITGNG